MAKIRSLKDKRTGKLTKQSISRSAQELVRETMADLGVEGPNFEKLATEAVQRGDIEEAREIGRSAAKNRTLNQLFDMFPKELNRPPSQPKDRLTPAQREMLRRKTGRPDEGTA